MVKGASWGGFEEIYLRNLLGVEIRVIADVAVFLGWILCIHVGSLFGKFRDVRKRELEIVRRVRRLLFT